MQVIKKVKQRWQSITTFSILFMISLVMPTYAEDEGLLDSSSSFLWQITYEGQDVGALLGTVHIGTENSVIPEAATLLLDRSSHLVTEIQILFPSVREEQMAYAQAVFKVFGQSTETIDERFGEIYAPLVRDALRKQRIVILDQQDKLSSEMILMIMMMNMGKAYQADFGMEKLLRNYIAEQAIENIALEEIVESLEYYVDASKPLSKIMIETWLDNQDLLQGLNQQLVQSYEANDIKAFMSIMTNMEAISLIPDENQAEIEHYYDVLLFKRNYQWLEQLTPILKANAGNDSYHFIGVGAFHLLGDEGMVELLRQEGFDVTPVDY